MVPTCSTVIAPSLNLQLDCRAARPSVKSDSPVRISLACMTCRSRKVRCNGESPCSSCLSSNRDCFFDQARSKRRRKSSTAIYHSSKHSHYEHAFHSKYDKKDSPSMGGHTNSSDFSDDHPSSQAANSTRIPYLRFLGPTAIAPGAPFREMSLKLVREPGTTVTQTARQIDLDRMAPPPTAPVPAPIGSQLSGQLAADSGSDDTFELTAEEFRRNADVFYEHMGSYLGCIQKEDLLQSLSEGKASEALKLAISALAECLRPSSPTVDHAELCSRRAKLLCLPHLALPSLDTTFTLLLLAYCEFAREKDSGLWMWSGLAFRMATDLGLHKAPAPILGLQEPSSSPAAIGSSWVHSEAGLRKQIFWSCYHLDRLISSGTGRVASLPDSEIEIELPRLQAISPENPLHHQTISDPSQAALLSPFHHLTQILILVGKISDAFNRSKLSTSSSSFASSPSSYNPEAHTLEHFRTELHDFNTRLPLVLHFTVDIARRHFDAKNGPAFLLLHLWFHSLVIITHNPHSVGPAWRSLEVGPADPLLLEISQGSVRTISDMIGFANVVDPEIIPSLPFASQPILTAGLASIPSPRSPSPRSQRAGHGPATGWREFEICAGALRRIQSRWRGVGWLLSTLESRARNELDVDLAAVGAALVGSADPGLINKLLARKPSGPAFWTNPFRNPNDNQLLVGVGGSGTLNEPASGRLVHQPDRRCGSTGLRNTPDNEQPWNGAGGMERPPGNRLGGHEQPGSTEADAHGRPGGSEPQGQPAGPPRYNPQACPALEPSQPVAENSSCPLAAEEGAAPAPEPAGSSYWDTQPIPQIVWPHLPSLEWPTDRIPAGIDLPLNGRDLAAQSDRRRPDFRQAELIPFFFDTDSRDESHHYHLQHLHPLLLQQLLPPPPPPPPSSEQLQLLGLPQLFEHNSCSQEPPSPVFAKDVWDHLVRGELGIHHC